MLERILVIGTEICGGLALLLGLAFWLNIGLAMVPFHMLLGLLTVLGLWAVGILLGLRSKQWVMPISALLLGVVVLYVGLSQGQLLVGSNHWIVQVVHLVLGVAAVGLVGMMGRQLRLARATPSAG